MNSKPYPQRIVYENDEGETFIRESDTYGTSDKFDCERETKAELDEQLRKWGFKRVVGYERP